MEKVFCLHFLVFGFVTLALGEPPAAPCPYAKFVEPKFVHTACLQPNASCTIVSQGVSKAEEKLIVKLHNDIREKAASGQQTGANNALLPQAANMRQLNWNTELATIAQDHANQCTLRTDCYRCRTTESYDTGESIYYQFQDNIPPKNNWAGAIAYWEQFSKKLNSINARSYDYSSFTQIIWAKTKDIGCGMTRFRGKQYRYVDYYVCLYGPAGNYVDENIYVAGMPCSDCTYKKVCCGPSCQSAGQKIDYPDLCKSTLPARK